MTDTALPQSFSSAPITATPPASVGRWTSLRSVRVTPPGTSPRVLLCPLSADPGVKVTEAELRRRAAATERVRDTVPRLLVEFADRLEAVFSRGTELQFVFGDAAERELRAEEDTADGDSINRDALWLASGNACPPTEPRITTRHRPPGAIQAHSPVRGVQNSDNSDAADISGNKASMKGEQCDAGTAHPAATTALPEKVGSLGTPGTATPPVTRRIVRKRQLIRVDPSVKTVVDSCPPHEHKAFSALDQDGKRMCGDDADSESLASHSSSHTFSVFTTPRRHQPDPEFKRPSRPRAQLKRSQVAGRWQLGVSTPARSRRSEVQLLVEGSSWQCDAVQTPHRRGAEPKPERVSNRWQYMSGGKGGRPRPDLQLSPIIDCRRRCDSPLDTPCRDRSNSSHPPADKTPQRVPDTPHRRRPNPQLPTVSDRCQDDSTTPRHHQTELMPPPLSCRTLTPGDPATSQIPVSVPPAYDTWQTPTGRPAVPVAPGPPTLSPGGGGDKLRRVYRWLENSFSVADPTEGCSRRRQRTPSLAGSSIASGRRRRPRIEYTEEEVRNLQRGVQKYGRDFKAIRLVYDFHPSRTTVDLYDKWRHMPRRRPQAGAGDARSQADRR